MITDVTATACALLVGSAATLIPKAFLSWPSPQPCFSGGATIHAPLLAALATCIAGALGGAAGLAFAVPVASRPALAPLLLSTVAPGALAFLSTLLQLCALLLLPAAVLAGLRGAFILLTAALSAWLGLKDAPVGTREWWAVAVAAGGAGLVGVAAAGAAALFGGGGGGVGASMGLSAAASTALGLALSLAGYGVATIVVAVEQRLLGGTSKWAILAGEGAAGVALGAAALGALGAAQPAGGGGGGVWAALDDPAHTLCCLRSGPAHGLWAVAYGGCSFGFNALLLVVAERVGPNQRVFVFTARGVLTWGVELAVAYSGGWGGSGGEGGAGTGPADRLNALSVVEAAGYAALIGGGLWRARLVAAREAAASASAEAGAGAEGTAAAPLLASVKEEASAFLRAQ